MRLLTALLLLLPGFLRAGDSAWWVWQPSEATANRLTLPPAGTLYWHTGTLAAGGAPQAWPAPRAGLQDSRIIPVLRLEGSAAVLENETARETAGRWILAATTTRPPMLQLDFDCPARLLPAYAKWLRAMREKIAPVKLSVTALAGWAPLDAATWRGAADEIVPMFYDLWPDEPSAVSAGKWHPLADAEKVPALLARWRDCPVPWRCGLANFTRVSRFSPEGKLAGHLRAWRAESLLFAEEFGTAQPLGAGIWRLPVRRKSSAAEVMWKTGETMIVRRSDPASLAVLAEAAVKAGAQGVVWFQLPSGQGSDGWSPEHLAAPGKTWRGKLARDGDRLVLHGAADCDLPPQWEGEPRGWLLELQAPEAWFRDASAGDYFRVEPADEAGAPVALALATRAAWRFAALPSGRQLRTGSLTLAPSADWKKIRWRVRGPGLSPEWKSLP